MRRNIQRHYNEQLWGIVGSWALVFHFSLLYMRHILRERKKLAVRRVIIKNIEILLFECILCLVF